MAETTTTTTTAAAAASAQQPPPFQVTGRTFDPFHSPRLTYRSLEETPEDEAIVRTLLSDLEARTGASYMLTRPASKAQAQKYLEEAQDDLICVVICLKPPPASDDATKAEPAPASPVPVGVVSLSTTGSGSRTQLFAQHRGCYLGVDVLRAHRGRGYGAEAIEWVTGYAFQMANMHRVMVNTLSYNGGAMRLYRRLGFVEEGRQREDAWFDGGWHDSVYYSMLEGEWRGRQEEGRGWKWGEGCRG